MIPFHRSQYGCQIRPHFRFTYNIQVRYIYKKSYVLIYFMYEEVTTFLSPYQSTRSCVGCSQGSPLGKRSDFGFSRTVQRLIMYLWMGSQQNFWLYVRNRSLKRGGGGPLTETDPPTGSKLVPQLLAYYSYSSQQSQLTDVRYRSLLATVAIVDWRYIILLSTSTVQVGQPEH